MDIYYIYNALKKRPVMYVGDKSYCKISAFILGIDCMEKNSFLNNFEVWICDKFNIQSSFA